MVIVIASTMFVCWMAAYVLMIVKGFQQKTYGMPAPCLFLNLTWEVLLGFVVPPPDVRFQFIAMGWAIIDLVIFVQYCLYGRKTFPLDKRLFYPAVLFGLVAGVTFNLLFAVSLGDHFLRYAALVSQLFMSWRYIEFLLARNSLLGQSLAIATLKGIGTLCAGILNYPGPPYYPHREVWIDSAAVLIVLADLAYIVLVYRYKLKSENEKSEVRFAEAVPLAADG
jgi:hypothetical protein